MVDILKHPLLKQCYELQHAIGAFPASEEETAACVACSELMTKLEQLVDKFATVEPTDYAMGAHIPPELEWTEGLTASQLTRVRRLEHSLQRAIAALEFLPEVCAVLESDFDPSDITQFTNEFYDGQQTYLDLKKECL